MHIKPPHQSTIIITLIFMVILGIGYYFIELGNSEDWENNVVDKEINQLLTSKNKKMISKVSADKKTEQFLLNLKKEEKAEHTSGFQGLTPDHLHSYGTEIKKRDFELSIQPEKKKNIIDYIFPKYKIKKVILR
ncbi:hypothetical protein M3N64_04990 [Sporolactobacillus sp. CPB3-1]|uniref:Uncharacterized protein n=1 Tax=Sporolactobacillus mangiferae TaxID=2940498 RepID=A0ABT0M8V5_9BACL|nr:hypothetical protein [Sporolactobacillus mangiferae]MCL1631305.1 hypothetical protein [Sporolactobacillus mangiferae]